MASFISVSRSMPRLLAVVLAALACVVIAASAAPSAFAASQQWRFLPSDGSTTLREGIPFRLYNPRAGEYYKYGHQYCGINLTSGGTSAAEWRVYSPNVSYGQPVGFNMPVGLYNESAGRFVRYGSRSCGINLVWSTSLATPDYNWQIKGLTAAGDPLTSATFVTSTAYRALFNRSNGSHVVYENRAGVNLGWSSVL
jgi:hypothetical protein